jgi:hypothetical protein
MASMAFTACQEVAELPVNNANKELEVSIVANISSPASTTRYAGDDVDNIAFQKDDKLGIFVNGANLSCWTLDTSWSCPSTVYWNDATTSHTFQAFYPFDKNASSNDGVPVPSLYTQSGSLSDLSSHDFMIATKTAKYSDNEGVVAFTGDNSFQHKLSLFALTLSATNDLQNATLNSVTLSSTDLVAPCTYSFDDDEFTPVDDVVTKAGDEETEKNSVMTSTPNLSMGTSDKVLYYVVYPQNEATIEMTINYTKDDHTYTATATIPQTAIKTGNQYTTKVSVNNNVLQIGTVAISSWNDGSSLGDFTIGSTEVTGK